MEIIITIILFIILLMLLVLIKSIVEMNEAAVNNMVNKIDDLEAENKAMKDKLSRYDDLACDYKEVCELVMGLDGMDLYTHGELIGKLEEGDGFLVWFGSIRSTTTDIAI